MANEYGFGDYPIGDTSSGNNPITISDTGAVYNLNDANYGSPVTPVVLSDGTTIYAKSDGSYIDGNGNPVTSGGSVIADETAPVKEVKLPNGSTIYQKSNGSYTEVHQCPTCKSQGEVKITEPSLEELDEMAKFARLQ